MKKKLVRKSTGKSLKKASVRKVKPPETVPPAPQEPISEETTVRGPTVIQLEMPPPEYLLELAEQEPDEPEFGEYSDTISVLRGKGKSYREIARWMTSNGVQIDHNTVFRIHTSNLSDEERHDLAEQEAEQEAEEQARQGGY